MLWTRRLFRFLLPLLAFGSFSRSAFAAEIPFEQIVAKVRSMTTERCSLDLARRAKLDIVTVAWEDTGRAADSSVGPQISDLRLQVRVPSSDGKTKSVETMPMMRSANFSDRTVDLPPSRFTLLVGNEKGLPLKAISLSEYLDELPKYLSNEKGWTLSGNRSLFVPRDSHVLVSAQASFLPVPSKAGAYVDFNPVLFNYQSGKDNPAVLAIVAGREGTSATIIDNTRDSFSDTEVSYSTGQQLFFNANGKKAPFRGERMSSFVAQGGNAGGLSVGANAASGLSVMTLIQVPLKHKERTGWSKGGSPEMLSFSRSMTAAGMEDAVISHGEIEGPFVEMDGRAIERDPRFPIRVTVFFYKATDSGTITQADMQGISADINRAYSNPDGVGSLVLDGPQGRPTEHGVQWKSPYWPVPFRPLPGSTDDFFEPPWWDTLYTRLAPELKLGVENGALLLRLNEIYGADFKRVMRTEASGEQALRHYAQTQKPPA